MWTYLKAVSAGVWDFILPFLKILVSQAGQILAQVAMDTVKQVALNNSNVPGDQKKAIAFDVISSSLKTQGIALGASVINLAIETAVQKLKDKQ